MRRDRERRAGTVGIIRRFDLDERGLTRVLGELESHILQAVWKLGQPTVSRGRHFIYTAYVDQETFMQQVADRVLSGLMADFGRPTLAHFVQEASSEQLEELERLISERRIQEDA
jgi:predicted transcriptional regulator